VPQADGTLVVLPVGVDDELRPSLLTLSDVMGAGHHAAATAGVGPGTPPPPRRAGVIARRLHGETRIRTGDTTIFSRVLYQLSYLARPAMLAVARP
jgi:hypothetical protein